MIYSIALVCLSHAYTMFIILFIVYSLYKFSLLFSHVICQLPIIYLYTLCFVYKIKSTHQFHISSCLSQNFNTHTHTCQINTIIEHNNVHSNLNIIIWMKKRRRTGMDSFMGIWLKPNMIERRKHEKMARGKYIEIRNVLRMKFSKLRQIYCDFSQHIYS